MTTLRGVLMRMRISLLRYAEYAAVISPGRMPLAEEMASP